MTASIAQQKIRIRLKAFDRRMLDLSCDKIIQNADTTSASAIGPIPLPTKRKRAEDILLSLQDIDLSFTSEQLM